MSGSAFNIALNSTTCFTPVRQSVIEYIDNGIDYTSTDEYAGGVGKALGVIAAVFIPFAAPAVWGAIASSVGITGALATAGASGFITGLTHIAGSALTGALMNAGVAAITGGDIGRAALTGALGGAGGAFAGAFGSGAAGAAGAGIPHAAGAAGAAGVPTTAINAIGAGQSGILSGTAQAGVQSAMATVGSAGTNLVANAGGVTGSIMNGIRQMVGNVSGDGMRRIMAQITNAAVNGEDMGRMNDLVNARKAELEALAARDKTVYDQQIHEAQQILAAADRNDPDMARLWAVADVAGAEHRQHRQAMRNIAVSNGGFDAGQRRAYERGAALHTARSKALAGNRAYKEAEIAQNQLRSMGAQMLRPDAAGAAHWASMTELEAARERANRQSQHNIWGTFMGGLADGWDYDRTSSPDPTDNRNEDDDDSGLGNLSGFGRGI